MRRQLQIWWGTLSPQNFRTRLDHALSQLGMRPQQYGYAMQHIASRPDPWLRAQRSGPPAAE